MFSYYRINTTKGISTIPNASLIKRFIATAMLRTGITYYATQLLTSCMPYIRAINYHDIPEDRAPQFAQHLAYFREQFIPATREELASLLDGVTWPYRKPGLLITFDDGLRSHFAVAAPLLEQFGFAGWFFVPTDFINTDPAGQIEFARNHIIIIERAYPDGRVALSWDEVRALTRRHYVGCHTASHHRMVADTLAVQLDEEIVKAKRLLEEQLQTEVDAYCWVGGEEPTYSAMAAACIRQAGYRYSFMTNSAIIRHGTDRYHLQRTNIEACWDIDVVRFQLSGILDLLYWPKRTRVNALTTL